MLERAFNCWEGLRRKDDRLPPRFLHKDIPSRNSKGLRTKPEELQEMLAYNVWRYMKIMAQVSTSNNKIDSKGLSGIATNTIRIARLKLLFISAKVVRNSNRDKVKYSIHDARAPAMMHFLRFLDVKRSKPGPWLQGTTWPQRFALQIS